MKIKILFLVGLAVLGILLVFLRRVPDAGQTQATQAGWLTDFSAAQERARAESKPLVLAFTGSDWCPPCMLLEKQVFSKNEFADYAARHLVLLQVDFPRRKKLPAAQQSANDALARRFAIQGFPTVLILGSDGKLKGQVETSLFGSPQKFFTNLEQLGLTP